MSFKSAESSSDTKSSTRPWDAAMPNVNSLMDLLHAQTGNTGVTSAESNAINNLTNRGAAGNQFAGDASNVATSLLNGGGATDQNGNLTQNLSDYQKAMSPYLMADYSTLNNPNVKNALDAITTNTTNAQNAAAAAAGRTGSGLSAKTLAQSIAQAEAPTLLNQANIDTTNRLNAVNGVYNAGNTTANTLSANNNQGNLNKVQGIGAAGQATNFQNQGDQQVLQAQELLKSIPQSSLGTLAGIGIPLAQLGTNSTSHTDSTQTPSMLDSIMKGASLFSGGANSAISGLTNFGSGAMSGAGTLLSFLGL